MKMTISVLALWCLFSTQAYGQTEVPNTFQAGQPARAAEVNANFDELENAVDTNADAILSNADAISAIQNSLPDPELAQTVQDLLDYVCLHGPPPYPSFCPQNFKFMFATSETYTGDLGGLAGADAKCAARAAAAGLQGTYIAWLSTDSVDARDRITDAPYRRASDNELIAISTSDLIDGSIQNEILKDEFGTIYDEFSAATSQVWTGTLEDGTHKSGSSCQNWTVGSDNPTNQVGTTGFISKSDDRWTFFGTNGCQTSGRLYCFEQ